MSPWIAFMPTTKKRHVRIKKVNAPGTLNAFGEIQGTDGEYEHIRELFDHLKTDDGDYKVDAQMSMYLIDLITRRDELV